MRILPTFNVSYSANTPPLKLLRGGIYYGITIGLDGK